MEESFLKSIQPPKSDSGDYYEKALSCSAGVNSQGLPLNIENVSDGWKENGNCPSIMKQLLEEGAANDQPYNPTRYSDFDNFWSRNLVNSAFLMNTADPTGSTYKESLQAISQFCDINPGVCQTGLSERCSIYTNLDDIQGSDFSNQYCGCFSTKPPDFAGNYEPSCLPTCLIGIKQGGVTSDGTPSHEKCTWTVCAIDDITIRSIESSQDVNLKLCEGCTPTNPCICSITDVNLEGITDVTKRAHALKSLNSVCGEGSICQRYDSTTKQHIVESCHIAAAGTGFVPTNVSKDISDNSNKTLFSGDVPNVSGKTFMLYGIGITIAAFIIISIVIVFMRINVKAK